MKSITPLYLYFLSLICLVTANIVREGNHILYLVLLVLGVVVFVLGIYKKFKSK